MWINMWTSWRTTYTAVLTNRLNTATYLESDLPWSIVFSPRLSNLDCNSKGKKHPLTLTHIFIVRNKHCVIGMTTFHHCHGMYRTLCKHWYIWSGDSCWFSKQFWMKVGFWWQSHGMRSIEQTHSYQFPKRLLYTHLDWSVGRKNVRILYLSRICLKKGKRLKSLFFLTRTCDYVVHKLSCSMVKE